VVAADLTIAVVPEGGPVIVVAKLDGDGRRLRLNDGACDPESNFWTGTMALDLSPGEGCLYRVDPSGSVLPVLSGIGISNGLGWSPDGSRMYYIDSLAGGVDVLDLDLRSGRVVRTRLVEIANDARSPVGMTVADGMAVDAEGHLWVAVFGAGQVRRYAPDGELRMVIDVPHPAPTSCAFGGEDLRDLYITTGGGDRRAHIFRCQPGVRGRPAATFAG
jgi:sugar lactone lactonase YvrE